MDLELVKNQINIFNRLKNAYKNDRLSHAYLFYGENGTGKLEMAYALACLLYCENDCCFTCPDCKNILEGNHLNVTYIGALENKKTISKEQIVNLQGEFSKTSLVEGKRIYIIDGIDTATNSAQNSLLKFIEEPINAEPTIGIFLATELANVTPTIQSRCNLIHFEALPLSQMIEILVKDNLDEIDAFLACKLTNNINIARNIINEEYFINNKNLLFEFLNLETKADTVKFYLAHNNFYTENNNLETLLKWLIGLYDLVLNKNSNLQLTRIYDKISVYKKLNTLNVNDTLSLLLNLQNKQKYNILAKNIFHELIVKL